MPPGSISSAASSRSRIPLLSPGAPQLAIRRADGSRWLNSGGLGWTNPYDKRVWKYNVDIAVQAAKLGFDEIQFDYVRFPSDGDLSQIRYPGVHAQPMGWTIPMFAKYASSRLKPLGVRVSVDVFGLSATRNLGIGQFPRRISPYVDAIYPMVYPSHYVSGEYNIVDPGFTARDDGGLLAARLSHCGARPQDEADSLAPGLLAPPDLHARRRPGPDPGGPAGAREGLHALERGRRSTRSRPCSTPGFR